MGLQLIIVVETNKSCKSDWIYIKETINRFYEYDTNHTKFSPIYMAGKGNYKKKDKEIRSLIKQYSKAHNNSEVIYFFDCDDYDTNPEDSKFIADAEKYCFDEGRHFGWFCKDIERVYTGVKVDDDKKKQVAADYKLNKKIKGVHENKLSEKSYRKDSSNILLIFDGFLKRK